ncbi:MAG: DUF1134 domain-containing protein [Thalassobaculum sp.]
MTRWFRAAPFVLAVALSAVLTLPNPAAAQTATGTDAAAPSASDAAPAPAAGKTYSEPEVVSAAKNLFGETTEGLAKVIEKVFSEMGQPNAYIAGSEYSGAIGIGLRYGEGMLNMAGGGQTKVYWQGPSIGFDLGGNASKVFVLVYRLDSPEQIFRRIPGVEGSYYFVAGVGVNYQGDGEITLAPIRTGVGLRSGVNIGYLHYSRTFSWYPF